MSSASEKNLEIGAPAWREMLVAGAAALHVPLTDAAVDKMVRFAQLMLEWNRKINLTAIRAPGQVARKHFIDSLAALPYLSRPALLLDIGSGGGFPGLVLGIAAPKLQVVSVDSVRKKISFQQHVLRTLGLSNVRAIHARAETLADAGDVPTHFDVIVSRAFSALDQFAALAMPLLRPGGTMIAYKGADGEAEAAAALSSEVLSGCRIWLERYELPVSCDKRSLVFMTSDSGQRR